MAEEHQGELVPLMTRLPRALHAKVQRYAAEEHRSLNAQVITMIEEAVAAREQHGHRRKPRGES